MGRNLRRDRNPGAKHGTPEDQAAQFPPPLSATLTYVGTRTLSSFLIVTSQGNILINSTYERNVHT